MANCWQRFGFSIDGIWFESLMALMAIAASALLLAMVMRGIFVWHQFNKLLWRLFLHPTRAYYSIARERRLPEDSSHRNPVRLFESRPSNVAAEYCLECARRLVWLGNKQAAFSPPNAKTIVGRVIRKGGSLSTAVVRAEKNIGQLLSLEAAFGYGPSATRKRSKKQSVLAKIAKRKRSKMQSALADIARLIGDIYGPYWRISPDPPLIGENMLQFNGNGEAIPTERKAGVIELGGIFVASRVTDLIQRVLSHLMNIALFSTAAAIALMLSVSEYPFPYRDTLLLISWVILLTVAAAIILVAVRWI
jgi:hypothetical protein